MPARIAHSGYFLLVVAVEVSVGMEGCNSVDTIPFTDFILLAAVLLFEHKNRWSVECPLFSLEHLVFKMKFNFMSVGFGQAAN